MISEEDVRDWEKLPLVSSVLTSAHMGAWLYYRDKRKDERIRADAIDEVKKLILPSYCNYCNQIACDGGRVGSIQECASVSMLRDVFNDLAEELKEQKN